ncbi:MAG: SGNH/GDSL hydrolase family protein [Verrucomicrobiota bacterium]
MKAVDFKREVKFIHAVELEKTFMGVIPLRFTTKSLQKFGEMTSIARMGTGIEMQVAGKIRKIEVTARCRFDDGYGICAEWFLGSYKQLPTIYFQPNSREVVTFFAEFPEGAASRYPIRFIFPTHCELEIIQVRVNVEAVVEEDFVPFDYRQMPKGDALRWLIHGDSITQGANVSVPTMTWVDLTARRLGLKPTNLAIGGHGKAELAMAEALAERDDFDILSLHIGANALADKQYPSRLKRYLEVILKAHPDKVVVLASPILITKPDEIRNPLLPATRKAMKDISRALQKKYPKFHFLPGEHLFRKPETLLVDGVHLGDHGAIEYAENLTRHLSKIIQNFFK